MKKLLALFTVSLLSVSLMAASEKSTVAHKATTGKTRTVAQENVTDEFKAKVKATIEANAHKSQVKIPLRKLKWETLSCWENYEKNGFLCSVKSTETVRWYSEGDENKPGVPFRAPKGVRVEVDKNGDLVPGEFSIQYECLECAA